MAKTIDDLKTGTILNNKEITEISIANMKVEFENQKN